MSIFPELCPAKWTIVPPNIGRRTPSSAADESGGAFAFFCKRRDTFGSLLDEFVYARHGRELMGLKSPVSVPVLGTVLT